MVNMKNNFTEETRGEFIFEDTCWNCNKPNPVIKIENK